MHAGMLGADMVVLTKEESASAGSRWKIGDYWSTDFTEPVLDTQQVRKKGVGWKFASTGSGRLCCF